MSASYRLIGHPLGHSLSPFIHKRLFALSGLNDTYTLYDIEPADLSAAFPALLTKIKGCNITIPHKQSVLPFIDHLEGKAAIYQTVNCVAVTDNGTVGYNTDADGFLCALRDAGVTLHGRVFVVGAGGAGTVLACEAVLAGCDTVIYNPFNISQAEALRDRLLALAPNASCTIAASLPNGAFDLLINATPVGMYPKVDACPVTDEVITRSKAVFDAVYNPRQTLLLEKAADFGAKTVGGMAMLVWQAAISHTHWYGAQFDAADIEQIINGCYEELSSFS